MLLLLLFIVVVRACGPGAYISNGTCIGCSPGLYQPFDNELECLRCARGSFSNAGAAQCTQCSPGFFNAEKAQFECSQCPQGWTQPNTGSFECNFCTVGTETVGNQCISCAAGTFRNASMLQCEACAPMSVQPAPKSTFCITCEQGKYQYSTGAVQCLDCPTQGSCCSGYELVNGTCTACNSSTYELDGHCVACPEHHVPMFSRLGRLINVNKGANTCQKCSPGTMVNDSVCVQCPAGQYEQNNVCLPCAIGTYQPLEAQQECLQCPNGFYTTEQEQNECTPCAANSFGNASGCFACESPLVSPMGSSTCHVSCPDEWIFDGSTCTGCPLGQIGSNGACVHCPAGKVRSNEYDDICSECPDGKITDPNHVACLCLPGTLTTPLGCANCSSGRYQPLSGQDTCLDCARGTYSIQNSVACVGCPAGYVTFTNGSSFCSSCPPGKGEQNGVCQDCAHGEENIEGLCTICPAGKQAADDFGCEYCEFGKVSQSGSQCEFCAKGQYAFSHEECRTCNASNNEYTNNIGIGSTFCITCDSDIACQSCDPGRFNSLGSCVQCPAGYISDGTLPQCIACSQTEISINNETECEICQDGKRRSGNECQDCAIGSFGTDGLCMLCQLAKYQDVSGATECKACPSGKTTRSVGHSEPSDCQTCLDLGEISSTIILDGYCTNCAPGKYVDVDQCTNCEPGRYRLASQTECEKCIIGKFSDGLSPCADCPAGFYNTAEGLSQCEQCITQGAHSNACEECAAGYRKEGASCIACEAGKFSVTGQVECQSCATGLFQDQTSSSSCKQCLPGSFADDLSSISCKKCTLGRFQPKYGQGACHKCPIGTYGDQESLEACKRCPSGTYTENEATETLAQCVECPAGKIESSGVCIECREGTYQNLVGQTECIACPNNGMSQVASTAASDCFSLNGIVSYVFGMKPDSKASTSYKKTCEIRPNTVLLCPGCSCYSDTRNGFWDGPLCNECRRGFATRDCTVGCANYDGVHDSTMCSGNGKCWFGKNGNGLCYCGGHSKLDKSSENAVVDVRLCPKGKICSSYSDEEQTETSYRPLYYIIQYRQYSSFVLQLNQYTPKRGHMWFQRFGLSNAYENTCQLCIGKYEDSINTRTGFWDRNSQYKYFKDVLQTKNGFHGENCQYECGLCLNGGNCNNVPHPYSYSYSIEDTYRPQKTVYLPITKCICSSIAFSSDHMCCPNGFQPYVYYGVRQSVPYSRFTKLPLITDIVNMQNEYWIDRDILLEPSVDIPYEEPSSGTITIANNNRLFSEDSDFVQRPFDEYGPYNKHKFYGVPRDICRACPGLFGKGVRSQNARITDESEAESFWWDNAIGASSRKCNGVGICDFYNYADEPNVHFMGDADSHTLVSNQRTCDATPVMTQASSPSKCAKKSAPAHWFMYSESYLGGSFENMLTINGTVQTWDTAYEAALSSNEKGYAEFQNETHTVWYALDSELPIPDSNSPFRIYPPNAGACAGYDSCDTLIDSPGSQLYERTFGRGSDRLPESTFNRFDTCFTFTFNDSIATIDEYTTVDYRQGLDPFLGGWCPKGHFCSEYNGVGYKEACPPGYYQPHEGVTRTNIETQCSKSQTLEEGCDVLETTSWPFDYVDKVCIRCKRNEWSAAGSSECSECPQGRVKKVSGIFDVATPMLNFPKSVDENSVWYYHANDTGVMIKDCAIVPESVVHIPTMDKHMSYSLMNFLPVLSCPYGFSSRPGTFTSDVGDDAVLETVMLKTFPETSSDTISSILDAPYVQMKPTYEYRKAPIGELCESESMSEIESEITCRRAARKFGVKTLIRQNGIRGCTYMPNIDPTVVFWSLTGPKTCLEPVQHFCRLGENNDNVFGQFVRSYCFYCPGSSVTGPESGTCATCFENKMKYYAKSGLRKIAQQNTIDMKDKSTGDKIEILFEDINNIVIEPTAKDFSPEIETEPMLVDAVVSIEDCYLVCQSVEGLTAVGVKNSGCACSTTSEIATSAENDWAWYEKSKAHVFEWSQESMPLCTSCQPGQYKLNGCTNCPEGYYTSTTVEANQPECQMCIPGFYQDEQVSALCKQCPAGYIQDGRAEISCKKCAVGKYQTNTAQTFCSICPAGFYQENSGENVCTECPEGRFNDVTSTTKCKDCLPGKYSALKAAEKCTDCAKGRYASQHGRISECTRCSSGQYQTSTGQESCIQCQIGKYGDEGGEAICKDCPYGFHQNEVAKDKCIFCSGGAICTQNNLGKECSDGYFLPNRTWATVCDACGKETSSNSLRTACQDCADGKTTFGKIGAVCEQCPERGIDILDGKFRVGDLKTWLISQTRQVLYIMSNSPISRLAVSINNNPEIVKITSVSGWSDTDRYALSTTFQRNDIGKIIVRCQYSSAKCKFAIVSVPIPDHIADNNIDSYVHSQDVNIKIDRGSYTIFAHVPYFDSTFELGDSFQAVNGTFFKGDPVTTACL